ncbi:MAG: PQQ-dependent sugar dehydrogenase [Leptospiraceae bacterium]|nr:PQQ-dependent sugar dehydrogenase [Leptospiraceae bacterium]
MNIRLLTLSAIFASSLFSMSCEGLRATLIGWFSPEYVPEGEVTDLEPEFSGPDANRKQINIQLAQIASGWTQITELGFHPASDRHLFIAQKKGKLSVLDLKTGEATEVLNIKVPVVSEQGLLGFAFHPKYVQNGYIFVNYSVENGERRFSRVSRFTVKNPGELYPAGSLEGEKVLMEVDQPYQNHNAGRLDFGPDGMLYIGWGDGGWRADPDENGQNPRTVLGAMLRIDVDKEEDGKPYAVPRDNPYFKEEPGWAREVWAIGLRNPWKYSFDPQGRLIVADVGQDAWEEVTFVDKGDNLGWNTIEGTHCFDPEEGCDATGLRKPIYEYSHEEGQSITGGYVYLGSRSELKGKYIFGDFVKGRIWAIDLPSDNQMVEAYALGKWPLLISTFARDSKGEVYVADFASGKIYRIL